MATGTGSFIHHNIADDLTAAANDHWQRREVSEHVHEYLLEKSNSMCGCEFVWIQQHNKRLIHKRE
jgi:hypothetical protein